MERQNKFERRQMLKLTGAAAAGSMLAGGRPVAAQQSSKGSAAVYRVVRPIGDVVHPVVTQAPRLDGLDGKTICMVSNGGFKSHVTFPVIEELLRKNYPKAKLIPFTEMPQPQKPPAVGAKDKATEAMIAALKEKGCQVVISGNGG